jgi:hypothetical protein
MSSEKWAVQVDRERKFLRLLSLRGMIANKKTYYPIMNLNDNLFAMFGDRTAPDGSLVRENFAKWFGESKVVDNNGKPLVVYHGTLEDFSKFNSEATQDGAFHFGTPQAAWDAVYQNPAYEEDVDEDGHPAPAFPPSLIPAYLLIKNPIRLKDHDDDWFLAIQDAKRNGHDGIVYENAHEDVGSDSWIAFYPEQIKSAIGNIGSFSQNDYDIADRSDPLLSNAKRAQNWIDNSETIIARKRISVNP